MELAAGEHMSAHAVDQRREQFAGSADPTGECGAVEVDVFACVDLRLAVQRTVIGVFCNQHVRQESRPGQPAVDGSRRRLGLHEPLAGCTAQLRANMANDLETGAYILQHLRDILAKCAQSASAIRTRIVAGHVGMHLTRQMFGQWPARRLRGNRGCTRSCCGFALCTAVSFQFFELQLQLFNLPQHLLALHSEEHALELFDQQLEVRNLRCARTQRCGVLLLLRCILLLPAEEHRLQSRMIESIQINRHERVEHARSMPRKRILTIKENPCQH